MEKLISVAALIVAGLAFFLQPAPQVVQDLGASGQTQTARGIFLDNVTIGGQTFATTSQGAATYTAASIANSRVIEHIASATLTATLPTNAALSAVGFLPNAGDTQTVFIYASTTKITLAGNTGVILSSATSTNAISPNHVGRLECTRMSALNGRNIWCALFSD